MKRETKLHFPSDRHLLPAQDTVKRSTRHTMDSILFVGKRTKTFLTKAERNDAFCLISGTAKNGEKRQNVILKAKYKYNKFTKQVHYFKEIAILLSKKTLEPYAITQKRTKENIGQKRKIVGVKNINVHVCVNI